MEVLVAIGLLSLLIVTFGKTQHSLNQMNRQSELRTRGYQLAQQSIETAINKKMEIFNNSYVGDYYIDSAGTWHVLSPSEKEEIANEPKFKRKMNIANAWRDPATNNISEVGTEDTLTKIITVTVWYYDKNSEHSLNLKTILTKWED